MRSTGGTVSAHLMLIALGPVQDFIAQARRTRDLWFGSHWLSELSRCGAKALAERSRLVFPALERGDLELEPCNKPRRPNGQPPMNVANKLLAEVPDSVRPEQLAAEVREAVATYWRDQVAGEVKGRCRELLGGDVDAVWREQIDTLIEFYAAWSPLDERPYAEVRQVVERALGERKALRDFAPWPRQCRPVHKSSLDGARETVLRRHDSRISSKSRPANLLRMYRIDEDEELDAVGLVKRAGGDADQFTPVMNVAAASWLAFAQHQAPVEFARAKRFCEDFDRVRQSSVRGSSRCAELFGFEAGVLYPSRKRRVLRELDADARGKSPEQWWEERNEAFKALHARVGEPCSDVACLAADGDRMGDALDRLGSADDQRAFSRRLAAFAAEARRIVEVDHLGALVYAGGDDVLAFVAPTQAVACAEALQGRFKELLAEGPWAPAGTDAKPPSLSVGVGIGHMLEGLGDLVALGRDAETLAKGAPLAAQGRDRNALAVIVQKRTGDRRAWRSQWSDEPTPSQRLQHTIATANQLPTRKVYAIARTLARLPDPSSVFEGSDLGWARVLTREVGRALARAFAGEKPLEVADVGLSWGRATGGGGAGSVSYAEAHRAVREWVDLVLVARSLAGMEPRLRGPNGEAEGADARAEGGAP
jgi:CRISPR-associated protein Cmr2